MAREGSLGNGQTDRHTGQLTVTAHARRGLIANHHHARRGVVYAPPPHLERSKVCPESQAMTGLRYYR